MSWVLILTHPEDVHADAVEEHLRDADIKVCRTDTLGEDGGTPLAVHFGGPDGIAGSFAGCDLTDVCCVWHRRPSEPTPGDQAATGELRAAIGGVLAALPHLNHPAAMATASLKPYQLALATRYGLRVPESVVSTEIAVARALADRLQHRVVVKPLGRGVARFVTTDDRSGWSGPVHLTQQRIDKAYDVRVTMVDGTPFGVRIDSTALDWRSDPDGCHYRVIAVPPTVSGPIRRLLSALRLRFGALDFAVDRSGQWWFLEVNPNGQWLWLEQATGVPISRAIAAALCRPASR